MIIEFLKLNYIFFFIEYFIGIMVIYILIVYSLIVNNIYGIFIQKTLCDCLNLNFLLVFCLILNDPLFFLIDFNINIFVGLNKLMVFDYLSIFSKLILSFLTFIFFTIISNILRDYGLISLELLLLLILNILGLIFLCSSFDLLLIFISIEFISLSSYFLVALKKNYYYSIESSIKYLIIGTISGSFFLLGSLLFYYNFGTILISNIYLLILNIEYLFFSINNIILKKLIIKVEQFYCFIQFFNSICWFYEYLFINKYLFINSKPIIELSFIFILISIFIKLFLSPFHLWAVEIYEKSTSIITFFFILLTKLSYFIILFRICYLLLNKQTFIFNFIILLVSFFSIFIGSFSNLYQKKIKTLLVYSSISHTGYIFVAFSINSFFSLETCYFYLFNYLLSNITIWYIVLTLRKKTKNYNTKLSKDIAHFVLLNKTNKIITFGILIVFFSTGGIPPFLGFLAKLNIFLALISEKLFSLVLLISICSIVSIFYYIRIIKILYFENLRVGNLYIPISSINIFSFCLFSFTLFFFFINPKLLYLIVHKIILFDNFK